MKRKLREFAGGYMNTSEGVVKERSVGAHLNRHAGAYVGTVLAPVLGTGIGALIDVARKKSSLIKTADENAVSARTAAALGGINRNLSANLKPALRELAARSEKLTEFAMVRDASGKFVEVDDKGGMGVGTALKVGAGAAALGGAGYGAYRADRAIMGKFAPGVIEGMAKPEIAKLRTQATTGFGNMQGNSAEKLASFKAAKQAATQTGMANATSKFGTMGGLAQRKAVYGAAGKGLLSKVAGLAKFLR